ncbi:MAG TPA: hypothetical protein VNZ52_10055 [Candidatus Thermoplasmatota archaeon]|nr:hypothetical protein [Candidatus Thermoplasmatota archaeon]
MIDPSAELTVGEAVSLLLEALEEGAGEYDPALPEDVSSLLAEALPEEAPLATLPVADAARVTALLRRAGVFMPERRVFPQE